MHLIWVVRTGKWVKPYFRYIDDETETSLREYLKANNSTSSIEDYLNKLISMLVSGYSFKSSWVGFNWKSFTATDGITYVLRVYGMFTFLCKSDCSSEAFMDTQLSLLRDILYLKYGPALMDQTGRSEKDKEKEWKETGKLLERMTALQHHELSYLVNAFGQTNLGPVQKSQLRNSVSECLKGFSHFLIFHRATSVLRHSSTSTTSSTTTTASSSTRSRSTKNSSALSQNSYRILSMLSQARSASTTAKTHKRPLMKVVNPHGNNVSVDDIEQQMYMASNTFSGLNESMARNVIRQNDPQHHSDFSTSFFDQTEYDYEGDQDREETHKDHCQEDDESEGDSKEEGEEEKSNHSFYTASSSSLVNLEDIAENDTFTERVYLEGEDGQYRPYISTWLSLPNDYHVVALSQCEDAGTEVDFLHTLKLIEDVVTKAEQVDSMISLWENAVNEMGVRFILSGAPDHSSHVTINGEYKEAYLNDSNKDPIVDWNGKNYFVRKGGQAVLFFDENEKSWIVSTEIGAAEDWLCKCKKDVEFPHLGSQDWVVRDVGTDNSLYVDGLYVLKAFCHKVRNCEDVEVATSYGRISCQKQNCTPGDECKACSVFNDACDMNDDLFDLVASILRETDPQRESKLFYDNTVVPAVEHLSKEFEALKRRYELGSRLKNFHVQQFDLPHVELDEKMTTSKEFISLSNSMTEWIKQLMATFVSLRKHLDKNREKANLVSSKEALLKTAKEELTAYFRTNDLGSKNIYSHEQGLVHIMVINRQKDTMFSPSLDAHETAADGYATAVTECIPNFREKLWNFYMQARQHCARGYTLYMCKRGGLRFLYTMWFENKKGQRLRIPDDNDDAFKSFSDEGSVGSGAFQRLGKKLFPGVQVHCYEVCHVSFAFLDMKFACEQVEALVKRIKPTLQ
eukprot:m.174520 g.174520  ORF g.174520 m.174520 type:complete len:910 (-) comp13508_c0_seq5:2858-5587(-)